ncbi:TonB-dependent receptor plug domain-containing protein [Roseateles saccharophilus]|uniref:TonB-dependent receptor-like protein n=1 Tax=Roseateles saccharophilus TaxID=304 RepID=A0A4R3UD54_ROSSA|nr:TonB-dependent receptor [Roseateles saccharophilus]MDG0835237.1 TonB-dependent receptor [Roseateles saccharophilus]TCU86871.1 TonB-dependent receptor-like protein [Roseateles saccharophilus]
MKPTKLMAVLMSAGLCTPLLAAEDDAAPQKIERVEVTGSSIKRINAETASPVQVITAKEIENMGARTLLQVLDNLPAARPAEQQDFRSMFTGSDGASSANLRGLGAQGTLILLNGRRLSYYGGVMGFQTMFVNIDAIPAAAIERMEVLTDGASAVYGSDAVAGVINVITKKSYQGLEVHASTDWSSNVKAYGEHQGSVLYGKGDLERDGYSLYGSLNYYKRDRIALADTYDKRPDQFYVNNPNFIKNFRIGVGSEPGVMNPGTLFVIDKANNNAITRRAVAGCPTAIPTSGGTSCVWDTLPYQLDTGPSSERTTGYLNGRLKLAGDWEGFAEGAYTHIDMRGSNGPRSFSSTTGNPSSWYSRNTGTTLNTFKIPFLGPNNVYVKAHLDPDMAAKMGGAAGLSYLLQDATNYFGQHNTDDNYRALAGVRGTIFGDWDFETALSVAGSHSVTYQTINVNTKGFEKVFGPFTTDPVTGRTYIADNPAYQFGVISDANAALIREAYPTFDIQSWTQLITWDAKVEGTIGHLPAGEVRAAFGANLMRESFYTPGNADAANGLITQQGGSWFDGKRTVGAVFGETIVPITKSLEVDAAARLDKYPNFKANLAPKIGVKWRAAPELLLRGTYSEGFRAPNLAESGKGGIYAQFGGLQDGLRCDETNAIAALLKKSANPTDVDLGKNLTNADCSRTVGGLTPPNPNLKPETAKISTIGMVFEPWKDVSLSLDYWFVYRRNEIIHQDPSERLRQLVAKYGPALNGTTDAVRFPISDGDRANLAALAAMCANPANAGVCPAALPGYSVGNLAGLTTSYLNRGRTLVDGFDIDARTKHSLGSWGKLALGAAVSIRMREIYNYEDGTGFSNNYVGFYGSPRLRTTLNADWSHGDWVTSLFVNYTGKTKWAYDSNDEANNNPTTCTAADVAMPAGLCNGAPAHYTVNLGFNWKPMKNLDLGLNIKNLFNRMPYYDPNGWEGYDHSLNLFGRSYSLSASYKFW